MVIEGIQNTEEVIHMKTLLSNIGGKVMLTFINGDTSKGYKKKNHET